MHQIFKTVNDVGLTDFLQGKVTEHEAICRTGIGKLDILSSGITSYNPAELLGNEIMEKFLNQNAAHYGIVLIDAPNILHSVETRILANQADGVVLVLQRGKTDLDEVVEAKKILDLAHARLVGTIINDK
jgi:capsular exopolysaccharide synthesis family protein